jgi:Cdc6-like AAA superfamily ATPase
VPPRLAIKALPRPKLVSSGPPAGGVSDFVVERLETAKGSEIGFGEVYEDYIAWCRKGGADPLDAELFADAMKRICERARVRIRASGGTAVFGLSFTAPASVVRA